MRKILIIGSYDLSAFQIDNLQNCSNDCTELAEFVFDVKGRVDLVCVLNAVRVPKMVRAPRNRFVKLVQEPSVKGSILHKFVTSHPSVYSKIMGHNGALIGESLTSRFEETAPLLFPQVHADEIVQPKTELFSIISSTLSLLPGHIKRNEFIDLVHRFNPQLEAHTFGRGRMELGEKEDALDPYMYSLAIENSQIPSYITEKILDCILRETVPVYFGAQNVDEYFPGDSVVQISLLDEKTARDLLFGLSAEDYNRRLPALREAKRKYLDEMQICCMLTRELFREKPGRDRWGLLLPPLGESIKWLAALRFRWTKARQRLEGAVGVKPDQL